MKTWLISAAEDTAVEVAIAVLMMATFLLLHGVDVIIRAWLGPQFTAIGWAILMLAALAGLTTYLIREANRPV